MADEWVIVLESGISTKEDFLSLVRSGALTHSAMDRITHPRIRVHGDTAIFTARVTNTAHYPRRGTGRFAEVASSAQGRSPNAT